MNPLSEIASRGKHKSSALTAFLESIRGNVKAAGKGCEALTRIEVDVALNSSGNPASQSEFVVASVKVCMTI